MISKKMLMALFIVVITVVTASGAFAAWPGSGRGRMGERMIERMAKDIGLTQQQKDKYMAEARKIEEESKAMRAKNREIFDKIENEIIKDVPDRKVVRDYMKQISQNNEQIQLKRMDHILNMRQELAPEQRAKLEKIMKGRKERANKRFEDRRQKSRNK